MNKRIPSLFIASTVEGLQLAEKVQIILNNNFDTKMWNQGLITPNSYTLEALIDLANQFDGAVFLFTFDDTTTIRKSEYKTVRDNIIFEYGLFIGSIGKKNTLFVIDEDMKSTHLPSDFIGINPIKYKTEGRDLNSVAGVISSQIKQYFDEINQTTSVKDLNIEKEHIKFEKEKLKFFNDIKRFLENNSFDFSECGVIVFDLDGFEKINRVFGNMAGDKILEQVSKLINLFLNQIFYDDENNGIKCFYFSGDEFYVIIGDPKQIYKEYNLRIEDIANAIVSKIRGYDWNRFIPNLFLTCSAGFTVPNKNENMESCLVRALIATKSVKREGGNGICAAPVVHDPRCRNELFYGCSDGKPKWRTRSNDDLDY